MQEPMQETNPTPDPIAAAPTPDAPTQASRGRRRLIVAAATLVVVLLALLLPPYINVSRYQRRVARNISAALGRPVHFDRISLDLLPVPGFTLEGFVVNEDPAFGSEPVLRANEVRANVRLRSLWTRHVEFSRIVLTDPSVNLVRSADGQWNVESLLLQASHAEAAPTSQSYAGPAPRFPYIEATGARLNLKLDQSKSPISLTEADFALWLPEPHQWHLRVEARPVRTDSSPANTGLLRVEGTLGSAKAAANSLAEIPIDLHGEWKDVQLGGLSRLLIADDAGVRGEMTLTFNLLGTLGHAAVATNLQIANARRADFVPPHPLAIEAECHAIAQNSFHSFSNIECRWPPTGSSDLLLTADLPDVAQPRSSSATLVLPALPAETFFNWLSVATPHPPTGLTGPGTLAASLIWNSAIGSPTPQLGKAGQSAAQSALSGQLEFSHESLQLPALGPNPIPLGDILLRSTPASVARARRGQQPVAPTGSATSFDLLPLALPLGGKQPASLVGHFDDAGYTLHLTGSALPSRLLALGDAVPQLGDGLRQLLETPYSSDAPIRLDLTATRAWGGPQTWRQTTQANLRGHSR
jgi:hypothetical protein